MFSLLFITIGLALCTVLYHLSRNRWVYHLSPLDMYACTLVPMSYCAWPSPPSHSHYPPLSPFPSLSHPLPDSALAWPAKNYYAPSTPPLPLSYPLPSNHKYAWLLDWQPPPCSGTTVAHPAHQTCSSPSTLLAPSGGWHRSGPTQRQPNCSTLWGHASNWTSVHQGRRIGLDCSAPSTRYCQRSRYCTERSCVWSRKISGWHCFWLSGGWSSFLHCAISIGWIEECLSFLTHLVQEHLHFYSGLPFDPSGHYRFLLPYYSSCLPPGPPVHLCVYTFVPNTLIPYSKLPHMY